MSSLEVGQRFERYRMLHRLGSSVSGESYEAEDTLLQRKVTLKLIQARTILPDAARRQFFREMQIISTFTHPYIAGVLDYGEAEGKLYIARRYVSPGSLLSNQGRLWFHPPFSVSDAIYYTRQLALALHHIHDRDYVHGSLTLTNILVLRGPNLDNEPSFAPFLIADIGSAHFVRRFGQSQNAPLPVTTAPEQFGMRVTPASDQYALAVILYTWLAGQPPFLGSSEEITQMKLTETIPSLSTLNTSVTREQESIIRRALSVYPDERYSSILMFTEALLATYRQFSHMPSPEALQEPLPATEPDIPQPIPTPDPIPQPNPQPIPHPDPEPLPQPEQDPLPEPAPDMPPHIEPDIAQPLPDSTPLSPIEPAQRAEIQSVASAYLVVLAPHTQEPQEFVLKPEETTLGRAGSSDIVLDQDTVTSRHHAVIKHEEEHYLVYDCHSTRGVFVNGQQISVEKGHTLTEGDQIEIGEYILTFRSKALLDVREGQEEHALYYNSPLTR